MLTLFVASALAAPRFQLEASPYVIEGYDMCLPSELRVVVEHDDRAPAVSITTVVGAGSADDPEGSEGVAHVLEHVALRRTRDQLLDTGAIYNGSTWPEATLYTTLVPVEQFEEALLLEAGRLADPLAGVTEADVAMERATVTNELGWRGELTDRKALAAVYKSLYPPSHAFHRGFADASSSVAGISLDDLKTFVDAHYQSHNMSLHIVGPVDAERVQQILQDDFDQALVFEKGPHDGRCVPSRPSASPEPPPPTTTELTRVEAPALHRTLYLGWSLPGGFREDDAMASIAVDYLEQAVASRLYRVSKRGREDYFGLGCALLTGVAASTAICALELPDRVDVDDVLNETRKGLSEMEGAAEREERERWFGKSRMRAFAWTMETAEDRVDPMSFAAETRARHSHFSAQETWYDERVSALMEARHTTLERFAGKWLTAERSVAVLMEPGSAAPVASIDAAQATVPDPPLPDFEASAIAELVHGFDAEAVKVVELNNGMRVVAAQFGDVPLSHAALVMEGGDASDPLGRLELAESSLRFDWMELDMPYGLAALNIGGRFGSQEASDFTRIDISGSSGNIDDQLFLLRAAGRSADMTFPDRSSVDDSVRWRLKSMYEDPWAWAILLRRNAVLGEPMTGEVMADPFAHWFEFKPSDARKWWKSRWHPGNATIYVVSSEPPGTAITYATRLMNTWSGRGEAMPQPLIEPAAPAPDQVQWFRASTLQSQVASSCRIDPADRETADVVVAWLRSNLWRELRERTAATYTPFVSLERVGPNWLLHMSATVPDSLTGQTADTMRHAVSTISKGLSDEEVQRSKLRTARGTALELLSVEGVLDALIEQDRSPGGLEGAAGRGERLAAVDAAALSTAMAPCSGHTAVSVVGPNAPSLKGEGAPEVVEVGWEAHTERLLQQYDPAWLDKNKR